jgi:short-subunit dehydrogenase
MGAFDRRVAFITGASSGIGEALGRQFAREGADVALVARRADRLDALAAEIAGTGRRALALSADVTRDGDLERAAAETRSAFGRIDVVIANAGFGVNGNLERLTIDDYRRQFETNVFGVLRTVYATLPDLKASRGVLAMVGSVSGYLSIPGISAYSMSKFAVTALAEALSHELAAAGVSVLLVSPGFVESELRVVDNQGVFKAHRKDPIPNWLQVPADKAAAQIVRAAARREGETIVANHAKFAVFMKRHAPWLINTIMRLSNKKQPERRWREE